MVLHQPLPCLNEATRKTLRRSRHGPQLFMVAEKSQMIFCQQAAAGQLRPQAACRSFGDVKTWRYQTNELGLLLGVVT